MKIKDDIKVVIADNSVIIRNGLASVLKRFSDYNFQINEISTQEALTIFLRLHTPDLLICNPIFAQGFNINAVKKDYPTIKTMALVSALLDSQALASYDSSITICDDVDTICNRIKDLIYEPDSDDNTEQEPLSSREKEIIGCVVKGLTNKAIADSLSISVHTVITHRRNITRKLQIHSAAGLAIYAIANNIVNIEDIKDDIN